MNKTTAIREARRYVGRPIRVSSTSYHVYGPYRASEPDGPSTQQNYDSFWKARAGRALWVAHIALALMGKLTEDACAAMDWHAYDGRDDQTIETLVDVGLRATPLGKVGS